MPHKFINRLVEIDGKYVSCTTCAVNYNKEMQPLYCQEFNKEINPRQIQENHDAALKCKFYCPVGLPRWARVVPKEEK